MTRFSPVSIGLVLATPLLLGTSVRAQVNLLLNPGFETGATQPDGWSTFPTSPPGITFGWDHSVAHGGAASVSIEGTQPGFALWRQQVPVVAEEVYTYSGHVNVENVVVPGYCKMELVFRDAVGGVLEFCEILRHTGTIEWIYDLPHEKCFRAPVGAVSAEVSLHLNGVGKVWFDDVWFGLTPTGGIEGVVTDGASPVAGATVALWGTELQSVTDTLGRYSIWGVPVASPRYVLITSKGGYRSLPQGNVDVEANAVTNVDFALQPGEELAVTEFDVRCGRLIWKGQTTPNPVDPTAVIDESLYPDEALVFLEPHEQIDSDHPLVVQTAAEILAGVEPADHDNTLAVTRAAYCWIVRNAEWDGVYHEENYTDVTSGAWQTITGEGWSFANNFAEWLYLPSEMLAERRGICIEHGKLDTALLRALGIPARHMQPYGGTQFWVQLPGGGGWWSVMNTSGGRGAYKRRGDEWAGYAATADSSIYGFSIDAGPWIHSDWNAENRGLWRERHPWSARYANTASGLAQALADLQEFADTGEAPTSPPPSPGPMYEIDYSDITVDLRNMGDQRTLIVRFPLPVETASVIDVDEVAFWTDHPECVVTTWFEDLSNPPVPETRRWFNIELDLSPLLPPGQPYCFGDPWSGTPCPCSNDNDGSVPGSGCDNGVFASGAQLTGSGQASVTADSVVLTTTHLEPNNSGLYFQADSDLSPGTAWGDGLRCAGGNLKRLQVRFADLDGTSSTTVGISTKAGNVQAGDRKYYQCWYRTNVNPPCGVWVNDFNTSNGYAIVWHP